MTSHIQLNKYRSTGFLDQVNSRCAQGLALAHRAGSYVLSCLIQQHATPPEIQRIALLKAYPSLARKGNHLHGEIELVNDPAQVAKIQWIVKKRLLKKGIPEYEARKYRSGVFLEEDPFWRIIRDPVIFPNGQSGFFNRLVLKNSLQGTNGAAALLVMPNGDILLNLNYRHATRSWEFELPRGMAEPGELPLKTVVREVKEETGMDCKDLIPLGEIAPDTGVLATVPSVFLCKIASQGAHRRDATEAIKKCIPFSPEALVEGLKKGFLEYNGEQIPLRDGFLTFALLQAHIRGLIKIDPTKNRQGFWSWLSPTK